MDLHDVVGRADLLYDSRRWDLAIAEYQRCLSLEPNYDHAHCRIAMCLLNQSKDTEALAPAKRALELDPENDHYHYIVSFVLQLQGKYKEALAQIQEAIELNPDSGLYHAEAANCYLHLTKQKEAEKESDVSIELAPYNDSVWYTRGLVMLNAGKLKEAHVAVDTMMELEPEDWRGHSLKGLLLKQEGKFSESVSYYREALRIDPTSSWARSGYMDALRGRSPAYRILVFFSTARAPRFFFFNVYVLMAAFVIFGLLGVAAVLVKAISPHLLNVFLALDPEGKNALGRNEQRRAKVLGAYTLASWIAGLWMLGHLTAPWMPALFLFVYLSPILLTRVFEFDEDNEYRRKAVIYVAAGMVVGLAGVVSSVVSQTSIFDQNSTEWLLADSACGLMFVFLCFTLFSRWYWRDHVSFF